MESNPVPEIVGCDVELAGGGGYLITHKGSRDTAVALTAEQAEIEGIVLRVAASWQRPSEIPFRTGEAS
ncbi:hypothetical protein ACIBQX_32855 [Nonomuraea sp. NPDC049714]|uniref:hypothetical protein n=1 Tax=Nonomuraea sp. NPDC049714 TaxID=3364357 RepID=UPI0037B2FAA0